LTQGRSVFFGEDRLATLSQVTTEAFYAKLGYSTEVSRVTRRSE